MGPEIIDTLPARTDAIEASMRASTALASRVIKRSYLRHYDEHQAGELEQGVLMLISTGEGGYKNGQGMVAREGVQRLMLVGHVKVSDDLSNDEQGLAVEAMEQSMIEEIKAWARAGVSGVGLSIESFQQSRQQSAQYGWIVGYLSAGPPGETTY